MQRQVDDAELKFCRDCRHLDDSGGPTYERCRVSMNRSQYLVTGAARDSMLYCSIARMEGSPCGPTGRLWEAKQ